MNDPVEVTAHFDASGSVRPVRLIHRGQDYKIDDVGRRWQDDDGLHILVMTGTWRVWELIFRAEDGRWFVHHRPGPIHA